MSGPGHQCPMCKSEFDCAYHGALLTEMLRIAKESGVSRLDLWESGAPKRIEFASDAADPRIVFLEQPDPPKDEPTAVEAAALRLAGRGKKAEAK